MKASIGRIILALWFVGIVVVTVRGMPVQGEGKEGGSQQYYLPALLGNVPAQTNPDLRDYVGLFMGSTPGYGSQIYTIRGDGSGLTQLTYGMEPKRAPVWSADGTYIAYVAKYDNWYETLVVMKSDGSELRRVASSDERISFQWSPTDNQLLVHVRQGYPHQLLLAHTNGSPLQRIATLAQDYSSALFWGWSPDGRYVHSLQDNDGFSDLDLWVWEPATATSTQLATTINPFYIPKWSPDSRELVFAKWDFSPPRTYAWYTVTPDGSAPRYLFDSAYVLKGWVMGNSHYLLVHRTFEGSHLAIMPVTGGTIVPVTPNQGYIHFPNIHIAQHGSEILYTIEASDTYVGQVYWYTFTPGAVPVLLTSCGTCRLESVAWASNQTSVLFSLLNCHRGCSSGMYHAELRPTPMPPTRMVYRFNSWSIEFLPFSSTRAFTEETRVDYPPYPPPYKDLPIMLDTEQSTAIPFPFPYDDGLFEFGEWRYLP